MKVSFDYDNTLSRTRVKRLAKKFIDLDAEVWIVTSRRDKIQNVTIENREVFETAEMLGIRADRIVFTNYEPKYKYVKNMDLHFDDDDFEIQLINEYPGPCIGILTRETISEQY